MGLLMPGSVIMFGVGAIIATGALSLDITLIVGAAGAIAGDGISYWLGRHYHEQLRKRWPFSRHPSLLTRGEAFFHKHGGKSVLLGRFVGPVRPVIPLVAGMMDMPSLRFTLVNVVSAVGWAFAYVVPGLFFGTSLALAGKVSIRLSILGFMVVGVLWLFLWSCKRLVRLLNDRVPPYLEFVKKWVVSDTSTKGPLAPVRYVLRSLLFREKGEAWVLVSLVGLLFFAGWGFLGVLEGILTKDPLVLANQAVYHFLQSLRNPIGDRLFVAITNLGDTVVNFSIAGFVLSILVLKRCFRTAGYWITTIAGGAFLVRILQWTIHPSKYGAVRHSYSALWFPSGHATMSMILYGALALLLIRGLRHPVRWGFVASAFAIPLAVAFSRLYLGVHGLSGVLGGMMLALTWTALMGILYLRARPERTPAGLLSAGTLIVLLTVGGLHVANREHKGLALYAPSHPVIWISGRSWLENGWRKLPSWRVDLGGEREQPLTVQWVGAPEKLTNYLVSKGWQQPPKANLKAFMSMLSPKVALKRLPILPHLDDGRFERVLLVRNQPAERTVFRLWPTGFRLSGTKEPLWVGTVEIQIRHRIADLITVPKDSRDYTKSLQIMVRAIKGWAVSMVRRRMEETPADEERRGLIWNGELLLIREQAP